MARYLQWPNGLFKSGMCHGKQLLFFPVRKFPKPGVFLAINEPKVDQRTEGSSDSQQPSRGKASARNFGTPPFIFNKVDGRKEDESAGKEKVVGLTACNS